MINVINCQNVKKLLNTYVTATSSHTEEYEVQTTLNSRYKVEGYTVEDGHGYFLIVDDFGDQVEVKNTQLPELFAIDKALLSE